MFQNINNLRICISIRDKVKKTTAIPNKFVNIKFFEGKSLNIYVRKQTGSYVYAVDIA